MLYLLILLCSLRKTQLQFRSISALMSVGLAALPLFGDRGFPPHPLSSVDYDDYRRERRSHWPSSVLCSLAVTVWKSCPVSSLRTTAHRSHLYACGSSRGSRMHSISSGFLLLQRFNTPCVLAHRYNQMCGVRFTAWCNVKG